MTVGHAVEAHPPPMQDARWALLVAAWLVATAATLGALFIGEVLGREPCSLCWYQRAFMFPLSVLLAVGAYLGDGKAWRYALPLAIIGAIIALFHSLLYAGLVPQPIRPCLERNPCSGADMVVLGLPLPYLALASFAGIIVLLILSRSKVEE